MKHTWEMVILSALLPFIGGFQPVSSTAAPTDLVSQAARQAMICEDYQTYAEANDMAPWTFEALEQEMLWEPFMTVGPDGQATDGAGRWLFPEQAAVFGPYTYGVPAGEPVYLNYYIRLFGGFGVEPGGKLPVRFYLLLNEEFQNIGDKGTPLFMDVELEILTLKKLTFELPPLPPGIHDVIVLGIPNVDQIPDLASDTSVIWSFTERNTLIAGDSSTRPADQRSYNPLTAGKVLPDEHDRQRPYLNFSLTDYSTRPFAGTGNLAVLPAGEPYDLNIHLGQTVYYQDYGMDIPRDDLEKPFALFLLKDYQPVQLGESTTAFYGTMPEDALFVQIPVTDTVPETGETNLLAIRIDYPGTPLCQMVNWIGRGVEAVRVVVRAEE